MKMIRFQCEECDREFVMTEADAVDEDAMSCPVDACQGSVLNADAADDEGEDEDDEDEDSRPSRQSGRRR